MSTTTFPDTVLDFGDAKNASLYFKHVVPMIRFSDLTNEIQRNMPFGSLGGHPTVANQLLPPRLRDPNSKGVGTGLWGLYLIELTQGQGSLTFSDWLLEARSFLQNNGLLGLPTVWPPATYSASTSPLDSNYSLTLHNFRFVDASRASWHQLLSFREDVDSQRKLRRLIRFLTEDQKGKSKQEIEDDLLEAMEHYESVAKSWGLKMRAAALSAIISEKNLIITCLPAIAASVLKVPLEAVAIPSTIMAIGRISLEIMKQRHANEEQYRELLLNSPIAYCIKARRKLSDAPRRLIERVKSFID
ncbi:MAG: hypothetical protein IIA66_12770 [Planctomycetes bacterium]|nr:hypothetical protein [Planctomycetota bacterium]